MWEHGLLVHVPKGVVVDKPLYIRIANAIEGGSLFWRLLIVAEAQSRFTVIEEYASAVPELSAYSNAAVEIVVEDGAKVEYVSVQNLSRHPGISPRHHATVGRDAELDWVDRGFGSKGARCGSRTTSPDGAPRRESPAPTSPTASSGSTTTRSRSTRRPTRRPTSRSRGRCGTTSSAVWRGMIRVEEGAQKTNAYQGNGNLLLSDAHADSIPKLEILANDVRCTHGATLGQVDPEQLFYLMARGLSRKDAERLIARASSRTCSTGSRWCPCARRSATRSRRASRRASPYPVTSWCTRPAAS